VFTGGSQPKRMKLVDLDNTLKFVTALGVPHGAILSCAGLPSPFAVRAQTSARYVKPVNNPIIV